MEKAAARQLVIDAGLELVRKGLIARTWGNVSCRVDADTFAITPSGMPYESLTPKEIVICRVADAGYSGGVKPSSERGIHALIYRTKPEAGFVIHTHQVQASAVSVFGKSAVPSAGLTGLSESVPVAGYGLPGTKKLRGAVGRAVAAGGGRAVLMAHHGALCFGETEERAFETALALEDACRAYIGKLFCEKSGASSFDEESFYARYVSLFGKQGAGGDAPRKPGSSYRTKGGFVFAGGGIETALLFGGDMPSEARLHEAVYRRRADIAFIEGAADAPLYAAAEAGVPLGPLLDDFAQIIGRSAQCARSAEPEAVAAALGKRAGVLVPGLGALCCAATISDAQAVRLVMDKDAYAQEAAELAGGGKPLSPGDCVLMHGVYQMSYSKRGRQSNR